MLFALAKIFVWRTFMCSAAQKSILWSAARKCPGARLTLPWGGGPSMIWCATNTDLERGQQLAPFEEEKVHTGTLAFGTNVVTESTCLANPWEAVTLPPSRAGNKVPERSRKISVFSLKFRPLPQLRHNKLATILSPSQLKQHHNNFFERVDLPR